MLPRPDAHPATPPVISEEPPGPEDDYGNANLPPGPLGPTGAADGVDAAGPTPMAEPPAVVRADVDVRPPRRLGGANPTYPPLALAARIEGTVVLECTIGTDGRVVDLKVVQSHPLFDAAALQAVSGWSYMPTLLNGRPVAVLMTVTLHFQHR
jgi:protein TonB